MDQSLMYGTSCLILYMFYYEPCIEETFKYLWIVLQNSTFPLLSVFRSRSLSLSFSFFSLSLFTFLYFSALFITVEFFNFLQYLCISA